MGGPFLCANGECAVLHARLDAGRRAVAAADRLARLRGGGGGGGDEDDDDARACW
jgi:hypothetical protein